MIKLSYCWNHSSRCTVYDLNDSNKNEYVYHTIIKMGCNSGFDYLFGFTEVDYAVRNCLERP